MSNLRTPAELQQSIEALIAELRALETSALPAETLVPLALSLKAACDHAAKIHIEIELRAIGNGIAVPGCAVQPAIVHRKWHDQTAAEQLAQETATYEQFSKNSGGSDMTNLGDIFDEATKKE